ncbi:12401_t:CDS:2 [Funneliformis caledonium]|uniref:12401_t:CDS:1 n=1 Tax=Funneliformis caledonium TaxID=1117310 RepID=A0A9N8VK14_9GLOM|nr:12401_t:CDS:2 [Funneliformis caledonium]
MKPQQPQHVTNMQNSCSVREKEISAILQPYASYYISDPNEMSDPNVAVFWNEVDHERELNIAWAEGMLQAVKETTAGVDDDANEKENIVPADEDADKSKIYEELANNVMKQYITSEKLEDIWKTVMKRLKDKNIRISPTGQIWSDPRNLTDLQEWRTKLSTIGFEDTILASEIISFFHKCCRHEINILTVPLRERDYTLTILGLLLGDLLQEFNIHTLLTLNDKVLSITSVRKECKSMLSPPSSQPHETSETPKIKRVKKDIFSIFDNLYQN